MEQWWNKGLNEYWSNGVKQIWCMHDCMDVQVDERIGEYENEGKRSGQLQNEEMERLSDRNFDVWMEE